jgi:hypothetical protein
MLPDSAGMDLGTPRRALLGLLLASLVGGPSARGSELGSGATLVAGSGWFDCNRRHDQAAELRFEYRSRPIAPGLRLVAASIATSDRSLFAGTGVAYQFRVGAWDLTPTFVPGYYRRGDGRDLGYPLEFRSQLEIGRRLRGGPRIAIALSHLSNAGLGSRNPGQESLTLNVEWARH